MATYNYTREIVNELYNINNIERVDGEGNPIFLAKEIEIGLPGKVFTLKCCSAERPAA